jgi:glycosyltransferase involved in cell wall biosynthesis
LRIALVVPGGLDRSGERRVIPALLALIERLCRSHEVHVFALRQEPLPDDWDLAGARVHNIGDRWTRVRAIRTICKTYRSGRPDVMHAIFSGSCGLVAVASALVLRVPSLVHIGGGELTAIPTIGYGGGLRWQGRLREALVLRLASAITAASAPVVASLARRRLPAQRVPLGVDLHAWPPCETRRRTPGEPARLIHVASLNRVKDQTTLLTALALLAKDGVSFDMDIVGEDTLNGEIQTVAGRLGLLGRVHFLGFLPHRQLWPLVAAAHLMVVSSLHETGPLVVLEAAAVGVPTVGTDVGHIAEWSPQAATAVPVGDPTALAQAIKMLLADEEMRLNIARKAREHALRQDADYTAARFEDVYRALTVRR